MEIKRFVCILMLFSFVAAMISPALALHQDDKLERVYSMLEAKPSNIGKPPKPSSASVDIRNLASGDIVYGSVIIIAQVTGADSVEFEAAGVSQMMNSVDSTDRYEATWDTTGLVGSTILTISAIKGNNVAASASVSLNVVAGFQWEVNFEIDYIEGHYPSKAVLDYIVSYWAGRAIKVAYSINDTVTDPTPTDGYISESDFWAIEKANNDGADNSNNGYDYVSDEKWMLYGTRDVNSNVGGYTYVGFIGRDLAAGNYIFIADAMIDAWEQSNNIPSDGGEVIVTSHESGHSVGIAVLRGMSEKYDSDVYSVMSYMRLQNAKDMADYWYYSKEYWTTANLNYYQVIAS